MFIALAQLLDAITNNHFTGIMLDVVVKLRSAILTYRLYVRVVVIAASCLIGNGAVASTIT